MSSHNLSNLDTTGAFSRRAALVGVLAGALATRGQRALAQSTLPTLAVIWQLAVEDANARADDKVVVTFGNYSSSSILEPGVSAFDSTTGTTLWTFASPRTIENVLLYNDVLIVRSGTFVASTSGTPSELAVFDKLSGTAKWTLPISFPEFLVIWTDDQSIVCSTEGTFIRYDFQSGQEQWRFSPEDESVLPEVRKLDGESLYYLQLLDDSQYVLGKVNVLDGIEAWRVQTSEWPNSAPAVMLESETTVVFAVASSSVIDGALTSMVQAYSTADGAVVWQETGSTYMFVEPLQESIASLLLSITRDGELTLLDPADGSARWSADTQWTEESDNLGIWAIIENLRYSTDGSVVVLNNTGTNYGSYVGATAFKLDTGEPMWSTTENVIADVWPTNENMIAWEGEVDVAMTIRIVQVATGQEIATFEGEAFIYTYEAQAKFWIRDALSIQQVDLLSGTVEWTSDLAGMVDKPGIGNITRNGPYLTVQLKGEGEEEEATTIAFLDPDTGAPIGQIDLPLEAYRLGSEVSPVPLYAGSGSVLAIGASSVLTVGGYAEVTADSALYAAPSAGSLQRSQVTAGTRVFLTAGPESDGAEDWFLVTVEPSAEEGWLPASVLAPIDPLGT